MGGHYEGGHYDVEIKRVDQREDIMMYKDSGWTKEVIMMGGHYGVDEELDAKGAIMMCK